MCAGSTFGAQKLLSLGRGASLQFAEVRGKFAEASCGSGAHLRHEGCSRFGVVHISGSWTARGGSRVGAVHILSLGWRIGRR